MFEDWKRNGKIEL